ncbi:MAG: glycosyltransferase family A protein [Patescibacteria group bacterium]|jgi:glycosyltransferase involved in cell wall biosynthesis
MISIIIPVYNQAQKLIKTLASLANQTYADYEVIIVNDGSTDGVESLFVEYYKKLVSDNKYLFINQTNQGAPAARNRGYQESRGDYLFFCDADAILKTNALEIMLEVLTSHPEASYAYPSFYWGRKLFKVGEFSPEKLISGPGIHTMALIRRVDFPASGWDVSIKKLQDWDLWLTMLEQGKVGFWINQVLFTIIPGGTISSWLPSLAYKLLPFLPSVKKYRLAVKIIREKHGLNPTN